MCIDDIDEKWQEELDERFINRYELDYRKIKPGRIHYKWDF